jgi:hypothetical protein
MAKNVCKDCNMTVVMTKIGSELVATDPELITVVTARHVTGEVTGGIRMSTSTTPARRLHAERCADYQESARRKRLADEQRAYNKQHGRPPRNHGL